MQAYVDSRNSNLHSNKVSLRVIDASKLKFYCAREYEGSWVNLFCKTPSVAYTFSYNGAADYEGEAEGILSQVR